MPSLPDITEVRPVDESDLGCLLEIRDVLLRHGAVERFGVNLLHDHFPVSEGEVLLEVCDPESRTLTIRPAAAETDQDRFVATNFQFHSGGTDSPAAVLVCKLGCFVDLRDRHRRTHDRVRG